MSLHYQGRMEFLERTRRERRRFSPVASLHISGMADPLRDETEAFSRRAEGAHSPIFAQAQMEASPPCSKNLIEGQITAGPKEIQINGQPALQYEIRGAANFIRVVYIHTTVDTGQHLHQILAWSLSSGYDDNRAEMESVVNSFQETPK